MITKTIKELIEYAHLHLDLDEEDKIYFHNILLHELGCVEPYEGEIDLALIESERVPDRYVEALNAYLIEQGMEAGEASRKVTYLMGLLTPTPAQVKMKFNCLEEIDPVLATDYLYDLSIANDYIAKTKVDRNIVYTADFNDGPSLEISINLSKPEKKNSDIAKLVGAVSTSYPKCLLCYENLGFGGNAKHPARGNIRFIPIELDDELWYVQYSPYVYYDHHCIVFAKDHTPMSICRKNFSKLFAFVERFPHFFVGSNADLPIVGGSILDHEHFQGGAHSMPLFASPVRKDVACSNPNVKVHVLDFYNTVLRLDGKDKNEVLDVAEKILETWRNYNDPEHSIISHTGETRHNTITPLVRKQGEEFQMFLILRNNRCDETYPTGIFHAHPEYAHIKQEGIGLIEAAGLFILPARLKRQSALVEELLEKGTPKEEYLKEHPDLANFDDMFEKMRENHISSREYIANVCQNILRNVAVYKNDPSGQDGLSTFLKECKL